MATAFGLVTMSPFASLSWASKRTFDEPKRNPYRGSDDQLLDEIREIKLPKVRPGSKHTFHLYVIQCKEREKLMEFLKSKEIETSIHYPTALPNLPAYRYLKHEKGDFPVANRLQQEILSLPMYPELTEEQIQHVSKSVKLFYADRA